MYRTVRVNAASIGGAPGHNRWFRSARAVWAG